MTINKSLRISIVLSVLALLQVSVANRAHADTEETAGAESKPDNGVTTGTLIIHARDLMSADGNLRFVLFDSRENFLKNPVRAEIVEIDGKQGTWTIEDVPYGEYAVLVHHDVDASGVMERHWYGKPKEPTGASNDAPARFGPPKFKKAKFSLETPTLTMSITVR